MMWFVSGQMPKTGVCTEVTIRKHVEMKKKNHWIDSLIGIY